MDNDNNRKFATLAELREIANEIPVDEPTYWMSGQQICNLRDNKAASLNDIEFSQYAKYYAFMVLEAREMGILVWDSERNVWSVDSNFDDAESWNNSWDRIRDLIMRLSDYNPENRPEKKQKMSV